MSILVRPPGDDFTFRLFFKLSKQINKAKDLLYLWSPILDPTYREKKMIHPEDWHEYWVPEHEFLYRQLIIDNMKNDVVMLGVKDHLTPLKFNPWTDKEPIIASYLQGLVEYYDNKTFVLFTSMENLESYVSNPNVAVIPWGGDITNHERQYKTLEPVLEKNLESPHSFLSLNRNQRAHRVMLVSLLYGLGLDTTGLVSCMFKDEVDDALSCTEWQFTPEQEHIKDLIVTGFDKLKYSDLPLTDSYEIYNDGDNNNVGNFKNKLVNYYQNTFVEIITETSYTESAYNITEKTLNSIYGCSFPILLCSAGSVAFLRSIGMDMFDDIIDHSYDSIENPVDRLYRAVTDNAELLTNTKKVKQLWVENQHRFINNVDFARNKLYNFYATRAETLFLKAIYDYNL